MPNFLLMFDWLEKNQKLIVAQNILGKFLHTKIQNDTNDSSVHNLLLRMCNVLADSIDALSITGNLLHPFSLVFKTIQKKCIIFLADETRKLSHYITNCIDSIDDDLNENFEDQLKFYTECRGQFKRLEYVQLRLTHRALALASTILKKSNQRQIFSSRIRGFFQVLTYIPITILEL